MNIEIHYKDPEELRKLTFKKQVETSNFLRKLKKKKPDSLDSKVHKLHDDYFSGFNCLDCANCCKMLGPRLTESDIIRLAKYLRIMPSDIERKFLITDEDGDKIFRDHPCPFLLQNNYCEVYETRPKACREYPHTDRKKFHQLLEMTHRNCETCPVVFEIIEALKKEFL